MSEHDKNSVDAEILKSQILQKMQEATQTMALTQFPKKAIIALSVPKRLFSVWKEYFDKNFEVVSSCGLGVYAAPSDRFGKGTSYFFSLGERADEADGVEMRVIDLDDVFKRDYFNQWSPDLNDSVAATGSSVEFKASLKPFVLPYSKP